MRTHISSFKSAGLAAMAVMLGGCITSSFPGGTIGSLYQWDDLETPVVTMQGVSSPGTGEYFDGHFDLRNLPITHPELSARPDMPWLLEACDEMQCQSLVLFSSDFELDPVGMFKGKAAMNAMTTLMANEVRGQPAGQVREMLERMTGEIVFEAELDYASFIALDLDRDRNSREQLIYPALYDEASDLLGEAPTATVRDLLGERATKTTDLEAASEFAFDSSWRLRVDVDLPAWRNAGAYLLLCTEYVVGDESIDVDYASCPLKAPLQAGVWQGEVQLTGGVEAMAAVIMPLQNPNDPHVALWERAVDGEQLVLRR